MRNRPWEEYEDEVDKSRRLQEWNEAIRALRSRLGRDLTARDRNRLRDELAVCWEFLEKRPGGRLGTRGPADPWYEAARIATGGE